MRSGLRNNGVADVSRSAQIVLGECKDVGGVIDTNDIENLRCIADAIPTDRWDVYIAFAKLAPFTPEEIG